MRKARLRIIGWGYGRVFGGSVTFTVLCRFWKEGSFYHFMSISGWSLLPIYRLKPNFFPPARYRGQATAHLATTRTPAPAPTLAWRPCTPLPASPPARLSRVVFHRIARSMAASCAAASRAFQPRPPRARSDAESFARLLLPFYAGSARPCTFTILVFYAKKESSCNFIEPSPYGRPPIAWSHKGLLLARMKYI